MSEEINEEVPVARRTYRTRSRRRIVARAVSAVALAGGAGGGIFAASASAASSHAGTGGASSAHALRAKDSSGTMECTPPVAVGTVESVDASGDSFTLKDHSGTVYTVDVSSSTTYVDPSVTTASLSDVTVGEQVAVAGTATSDTVTATSVTIGVGGPGGAGQPGAAGGVKPVAVGTVESVDASGDSFTLKDHSGTVYTVDVSSSTTYVDPSVTTASLSDVTVGEQVAVAGTATSDTVTATSVMIGVGGPGGAGQPGAPTSSARA